jgi:hypothetical protein
MRMSLMLKKEAALFVSSGAAQRTGNKAERIRAL